MVVFADERRCTRCSVTSPSDCFPVSGRRKDGSIRRQTWCRKCRREYDQRWRAENRETRLRRRRARHAEKMADPETRERQREYHRKYVKKQRQTAEGRERQREISRRSQTKVRQDPAYVEDVNARRRQRRAEAKKDPELYQKILDREREKRLREKARRDALTETKQPVIWVDPAPITDFMGRFLAEFETVDDAAKAIGIDDSYLRKIRAGKMERMRIEDADRVLTAAGRPDLLAVHYDEVA